MNTILIMLAALGAVQGQALELAVPAEPDTTAATIAWQGHEIPMVRIGGRWVALVGVDLATAPGSYDAVVTFELVGGGTRAAVEPVSVGAKAFRTTELTVEPRYVELSPEDQARADRESREIGEIYATLTPERFWTGAFAVPVSGANGGRNFGHRRVFNGQPRAPHSGADLTAATGTPIRASNRGRVVLAKELFFSGNAVFLDHGLGVYSTYLHLSEIRVRPGEIVDKGQVVGLAGATGRVTGPHLHWGVRILDARIDPFSLPGLGSP
jgi:murein DD-endopeptidase MepM/ murein hydrolase activator NlpD